jgi:hypothetical protein
MTPVTRKSSPISSTCSTLPRGSASPKYRRAADSVRTTECGSGSAVSGVPRTNAKLKIRKKSGSVRWMASSWWRTVPYRTRELVQGHTRANASTSGISAAIPGGRA